MKNVIPSETFKDGLKGQVKQEGEYFEMDHEVKIKLDDTDLGNTTASVELGTEIHNTGDCEESESIKYFQESEIGKIQQQHKDDMEILKDQHRQELEIEKEKRKVDIKEKEMYLRENQRLKDDNLRLKKENDRRIGDKMKDKKNIEELKEKIGNLTKEREEKEEKQKVEIQILKKENDMRIGDKMKDKKKIEELQEKIENLKREKEEDLKTFSLFKSLSESRIGGR